MKKVLKRVLAVGLVSSIMMTSFTACSSKSGRAVIEADTPWFNVTKLPIGTEIDASLMEYFSTELVGVTDTELIYSASGTYKLPDDFDWEVDNYGDYVYNEIIVYDYEGNRTGSIDIASAYKNAALGDICRFNGLSRIGDDFVVDITSISSDYSSSVDYQAVLDVNTVTLSLFEEVPESDIEAQLSGEDGILQDPFTVGDYTITPFSTNGDRFSYILVATDSSDNTTLIDFREIFSNETFYNISNIIDLGDGRGLIFAGTASATGTAYYILDTNTLTVTPFTEDMSWLDDYVYNIENVDGYGSVVVDQEGVRSIDFTNHTLVSLLDFNDTNVNRSDVTNARPVYISDDRVIIEGENFTPSLESSNNLSAIFIFERAESNPNVGKAILTIASLGSYNYTICESMCRFNETNPDYFLQIDTRYVISKFYDSSYEGSSASEHAQQALGNQLSVDLISGEGPDIIIDGGNYSQLNNADYLLDLSDYVSTLDSSNYFTNIIDEARTNGQIFQLPITYTVMGIVTEESNVAPGQIGFTYEEYNEFINTVCNGVSPIDVKSQTDFFIQALSFMPDLMEEDGSVNFNNDAFVALAEYTRDYVNNSIDGEEGVILENQAAFGQYILSIDNYINSILGSVNPRVLMGFPTYDGRGPAVSGQNTVGVVAGLSASDTDACLEYVSLLLDDTTQYQLGIISGLPINRNAFVQVGQDAIDKHNRDLEHWYGNMSEAEIRENGVNPDPVDYSTIEDFENLIASSNTWVTTDGAINAIIREEIPGYFEGQKSLDSIIEVLENRIHTLVNERG